jgi:RNA polymerase sigma factor (TIGR02999 family)
MHEVTRILSAIDKGEPRAADQLLPAVYDELRKLARAKLRHDRSGQTFQPTSLVHEAYLRLAASDPEPQGSERVWNSRGHFFAAAAEAMRRILIENARRKSSQKRGGGRARIDLDVAQPAIPEACDDLLALDEALHKLAATDADAARLVNLRYFAGLTLDEAAETLGISNRSANRLWAYARAWLLRALHAE